MKIHTYFIAFNFFSLVICHTNGQIIEITPAKDNTIYSEADSSNGKGYFLFSGTTNNGNERRALLKFDLSSVGESDSVISASIKLHMSKTASGSGTFDIYRLTSDWGESGSDAIFEEGGGATPETDDATWNYSFFNSRSWNTPGGDYLEVPSASVEIDDTGSYSWTDQKLTEDVLKWIAEPDSNFGWIIITSGSAPSSKRFDSKDNPVQKPVLILETYGTTGLIPINNEKFKIYPNPSYGELFIQTGIDQLFSNIEIADIFGRKVRFTVIKSGINNEYHLHIENKGTFFVKIDQDVYKVIVL